MSATLGISFDLNKSPNLEAIAKHKEKFIEWMNLEVQCKYIKKVCGDNQSCECDKNGKWIQAHDASDVKISKASRDFCIKEMDEACLTYKTSFEGGAFHKYGVFNHNRNICFVASNRNGDFMYYATEACGLQKLKKGSY